MVTTSHQQLYRFTVHYHQSAGLSRILDALFRAGAEPSWLFTRLSRKAGFRLDIRIGVLSTLRAEALAARIRSMPAVQSVKIKAFTDEGTPSRRPTAQVFRAAMTSKRKEVA